MVVSNNVVFGHNCNRSKRSAIERLDESASDVELSTMPAALTLQEVHTTCDLHIVGTFEGIFILSDSHLGSLISQPFCTAKGAVLHSSKQSFRDTFITG